MEYKFHRLQTYFIYCENIPEQLIVVSFLFCYVYPILG